LHMAPDTTQDIRLDDTSPRPTQDLMLTPTYNWISRTLGEAA
jgi:hypothetical protein